MKIKFSKMVLLSVLSCGFAASVAGLGITSANAEAAVPQDKMNEIMTQVDGASVRYGTNDGKIGLSYMLKMTADNYNYLTAENGYTEVSFGVLIAPNYYVRHHALNFENVFGANSKYYFNDADAQEGKKQIINCEGNMVENNLDYIFRGSVVSILDQNIALDFNGVGYAKYKFNGEQKYSFANSTTNVRSMAYVAEQAIKENNAQIKATEDQAIIADLTAKNDLLKTNYLDKVDYTLKTLKATDTLYKDFTDTITLPEDKVWFAKENSFFKDKFTFNWYAKNINDGTKVAITNGMSLNTLSGIYTLTCEAEREGNESQVIYSQQLNVAQKLTPFVTDQAKGMGVTFDAMEDGSFKYTNPTGGDSNEPQRNWGESGVRFAETFNNSNMYNAGYRYMRFEIKFAENVVSLSVNSNSNNAWNNWNEHAVKVDSTINPGHWFYVFDMNGETVEYIARNTWYTMYFSLGNDGGRNIVYTNGGNAEKPSVVYLRNAQATKIVEHTDLNLYADGGKCEVQKDGSYLASGKIKINGIGDTRNPINGYGCRGAFFNDNKEAIAFKMMFTTATSMKFSMTGPLNGQPWITVEKTLVVGQPIPQEFVVVDENGNKVTKIEANKIYTVYDLLGFKVTSTNPGGEWADYNMTLDGEAVIYDVNGYAKADIAA